MTSSATPLPVPATVDYQGVKRLAWANMANGDTGEEKALSRYADRSAHVSGDFGVGGAVIIEGTNNGTTWVTLKDEGGADLRFTSEGIAYIVAPTFLTRPRVTGGDGTTSITVTLLLRGEI